MIDVKEIQLKNEKPKQQKSKERNLYLTSKLKLNQWEIYLFELTLLLISKIPGYKATRTHEKQIEIMHKYRGTNNIIDEFGLEKIENKIHRRYDSLEIKDIKISQRLGYGVSE